MSGPYGNHQSRNLVQPQPQSLSQNFQPQNYSNTQFQQPSQDLLQRQYSQEYQNAQQPQLSAQGQQTNVSVPQRQYPQQNYMQQSLQHLHPQQNAPQPLSYAPLIPPASQNMPMPERGSLIAARPSLQKGPPRESQQMGMPRGSQQMGIPRGSQQMSLPRGSKGMGSPRESQLMDVRRSSRDESLSQDQSQTRSTSPAGRFFLSSVGIRVKTLSYEGFARVYFEFGRLDKDLSKEHLNKCLRFTPKEISRPLLKDLHGVRTTWAAVTIFAHILAYMEIIRGTATKFKHAYQILSAGISRPDLRDEIYCQLCRQTNYIMNEVQEKKGWELLLLCCSSFPPSKDFLPALEGHFQQVAIGAVKGFKGDEQAQRCLERLQRVAKSGSRYFLPAPDEIEAIRVRSMHTMTSSSEVSHDMAEEIGLPDPSQYGIFQSGTDGVEKLCPQLGYIVDIQNGWNINLKLQSLEDWRLMSKIKFFFATRAPVDDVDEANDLSSIPTLVGNKKGRLTLKRKLFLDGPVPIDQTVKDASIRFDYYQAVHEVMTGAYLLKARDALMLGALQLRVDLDEMKKFTEKSLRGVDMHKYEPKEFIAGNREEWRAEILKALQSLPKESNKLLRMSDYIEYLKSRCPLYQSTWIFVKQKGDKTFPEELFLAINAMGVHFADSVTKELLMRIPFTQICSWGHSVAVASIVTGNMINNRDYRLITRQGAEIGAIIELFISRLIS
ncbi:uncharacterized protein [Physcomitrium patens]|nr:unconventional myosin heavy chain 6-like isoform X2 [Physcomitrium patens]|eukprot:XP_024389138.1 unconventional myosin heavy chain 6-like isoform X2 [Physcomitrella patens]